jgi:hypothetical protein
VGLGGFSFENALFSHVHGKPKIYTTWKTVPKSVRLGGFFPHVHDKPKIIHNIEDSPKI